jgi:hypothetical protein
MKAKEHDDIVVVFDFLVMMVKRFRIRPAFVFNIIELKVDCCHS